MHRTSFRCVLTISVLRAVVWRTSRAAYQTNRVLPRSEAEQHSSLLQSLSSSSETTRHQQYKASVNWSRVRFNRTGRAYSRGSAFIPYPLLEDVYNQSNHAVTEDDNFADLGLNDFVSAQRWIAQHQLNRRRERLTIRERGLLSHPLEDWDPEEGSDEASGVIETCISYTAVISVQGMERDIAMQDEVHFVIFLLIVAWAQRFVCRSRSYQTRGCVRATLARANHNSRRVTLYGSFVPIPGN